MNFKLIEREREKERCENSKHSQIWYGYDKFPLRASVMVDVCLWLAANQIVMSPVCLALAGWLFHKQCCGLNSIWIYLVCNYTILMNQWRIILWCIQVITSSVDRQFSCFNDKNGTVCWQQLHPSCILEGKVKMGYREGFGRCLLRPAVWWEIFFFLYISFVSWWSVSFRSLFFSSTFESRKRCLY